MDRMTLAQKIYAMENPHKLAWSVRTGDPLHRMRKELTDFKNYQKKINKKNYQTFKKRARQNYEDVKHHLADIDFQMPNIKFRKPIDLPFSGVAAMVAVNALGLGMMVYGDPMTKAKGLGLLAIPEPFVFMTGEFLA